jgi:mannose-6-phosphate isomerase-like protein (cupin superfamily)
LSYRVAHLDDLERVPVDGGGEFALNWLPVRGTLGIRAFGTNAYVADAAGAHVVEPHTEGSGHEELYFVARGRATFTLAGETVDAPAGTYVFLPDGSVHRRPLRWRTGQWSSPSALR